MLVVDEMNYLLMENIKDFHHFLKEFFKNKKKENWKRKKNILVGIVCKTE